MMRRKWMQVEFPKHAGKTTIQMSEDFRVNFKLALSQVLDATPSEVSRVLLEKLPFFAKRWVAEAEMKKMRSQPILELVLVTNPNEEFSVEDTVEGWVGAPPHKVESRGGGMYIWCIFGMRKLPTSCWSSMGAC